jgi:hypothetical protein
VGRAFVKEVFQGIETMGVRDVGIEGNDINSRHDGVGGKRHGDRPNDLEEMVSVFYVFFFILICTLQQYLGIVAR